MSDEPQKGFGPSRHRLFRQGLAVVVGISSHKDSALNLPKGPRNDATDIADLLTDPDYCGYDPKRVKQLTDEDASLDGIRRAMRWLADKATESDTAVVYFSCHGTECGSLVPWDFDGDMPEQTGFSGAEFSGFLTQIKAERLLVLLDACHSAELAEAKSFKRRNMGNGLPGHTYELLAQGKGRAVFAAALKDERAYARENARNSEFTALLLEGLRGGAASPDSETIGITDLFNFVTHRDRKLKTQSPFLRLGAQDNFAIALVLREKAVAMTSVSTTSWNALADIAAELYETLPRLNDAWERAGGDVARLSGFQSPRSAWREGVSLIRKGGGGTNDVITAQSLLAVMLKDYPNNPNLLALAKAFPGKV